MIKAHIIPDWLHEEFYDEKHFIQNVNVYNKNKISKLPTGEYDENILCKDCDGAILSNYENEGKRFYEYFVKHYFNINFNIIRELESLNYLSIDYANHNQVYLFFLSILWRMHISKRSNYTNVNLHYKLAEKLRKSLLFSNFKIIDYIPIIVAHYLNDSDVKLKIITNTPIVHENGIINIILNGLIVTFVPQKDLIIEDRSKLFFKGNKLQILEYEPGKIKPFLDYLLGLDIYKHIL
ncbi:MAG TPA: hypothetical protein PKE39_09530 [Ignavibacteria bacterium]|nr:hypothetical protein [Ignavibacteria bacterium]